MNDGILVQMISKWMHCLAILLDKDKIFPITNSSGELTSLLAQTVRESVQATLDYAELIGAKDNVFLKYKDNLLFVVDVIVGILSISKLDFSGLKPLALKIGGFPDLTKIQSFFDIIKKNKGSFGLSDLKALKDLA